MKLSNLFGDHGSITLTLAMLLLPPVLTFLFKLYRARCPVLKLRRQGLVCHSIPNNQRIELNY